MKAKTVVILSTAHPLGDGRIQRWVDGCGAHGAQVRVVGLGSGDHFGSDVTVRSLTPASRLNRIARAVSLPATESTADVIVALDPELYPAVFALARGRRCTAIADVHEDFGRLAADHDRWGTAASRRLVGTVAQMVISLAGRFDVTVVADSHVPPASAHRRLVGRNVATADDYDPTTPRHTDLHAVYAGDLTRQRGLQEMLDGVVLATGWRLDLYGPDRTWARSAIADAAVRSNGRITYKGLIPQTALNALLPRYHVGLSLLHPIPSYAAALPSKLFEYHGAGLATITSELPRAVALVTEAKSGAVLDGTEDWPAQLAAILDRLESDRTALETLQRNARSAASVAQPDSLAAAIATLGDLLATP